MDKTAYIQHLEECPLLLKRFFNYMSVIEERSENSVKSYFFRLRTFFTYIFINRKLIDEDVSGTDINLDLVTLELIKSITNEDILNYLYYCKTKLNLSANSRAQHLSAIKKLFGYLVKDKSIENNPTVGIQNPKSKKALPKYLTLDEAVSLLKSIDSKCYERDYCIITLFLNCGLRLSELVSLNISSIRSDGSVKITGKGNKERTVYLNEACNSALTNYLSARLNYGKIVDKDALFVSDRTGKRIGQRRVEQIVTESLKKAGLEGYSTHKLRHTAATLMYKNGTDVRALQHLLGHSNLATTQIYTHVADEQVKNAVNNNPLSSFDDKKHNIS